MCGFAKEIQHLEGEKASLIKEQSALLSFAASDTFDAMPVEAMDKIDKNIDGLDAMIDGVNAAIAAFKQELKED